MKKSVRYIILSVSSIFFLLLLAKSWYYTKNFGGTDLRNRTVGSRLVTTSHSPYFYKWNPADGEYLLDPNDAPSRVINGNTVTPAVLWMLYPLATLPYSTVRIAWTFLQFILLFGAIMLLIKKRFRVQDMPLIPFLFVVPGLVCSDLWLFNIERGQIYILYTFLFSLIYWCYGSGKKYSYFLSGLIGGLFIWIRPLVIVFGLGFIIAKNKKWVSGFLLGCLAGCLLFVAPKPSLWKDYYRAMKEFAYEQVGKGHSNIDAPNYSQPATVEGMNNLKDWHDFHTGGLDTFQNYCSQIGILVNDTRSLIAYASLVIVFSWLFYKSKRNGISAGKCFLFGFFLYILSEVFIVAPRPGYSLIQWSFPVFLVAWYYEKDRPLMISLILPILMIHGFPFYFPFIFPLAELLLLFILAYVIFFKKTATGETGDDQLFQEFLPSQL